MPLTDAQRALAESAIEIVPKAIHAFRCRYPSLRKRLLRIDAESVAYMAICKAAVTYDATKSKVTTYFSMAIRNALLKEVDRERRYRYDSPDRVPMELAEALSMAKYGLATKLQTAIARLPAKCRKLIYLRFYRGMSLREIGEHTKCDPRTAGRRLTVALEALQSLLRSEPLLP